MVKSFLNSEKVEYEETKHLDEQDKKHKSSFYLCDLKAKDSIVAKNYIIALGKLRKTYSSMFHISFFPIYLISPKKQVKAKIGVFEMYDTNVSQLVDSNGDVDIEKLGDPLLFSFVTDSMLERYGCSSFGDETLEPEKEKVQTKEVEQEKEEQDKEEDQDQKVQDQDQKDQDQDQDEGKDSENLFSEEDDIFTPFQKGTKDENVVEKEKVTLDTLFIKEDPLPVVNTWPTETYEDSDKLKKIYVETKPQINTNWIMDEMKNVEYQIHPNEAQGDCLFACIRDAYKHIGYITDVAKLRKLVSQETTLVHYNEKKELESMLKKEMGLLEIQKKEIEQKIKEWKTKVATITDIKSHENAVNEIKTNSDSLVILKQQIEANAELYNEFSYMENLQTLEDYKQYILTSSFWADSASITILETVLQMKLIILESAIDNHRIVKCTEKINQTEFKPKHYILVQYLGKSSHSTHYELVSYKNKKIFTFSELPYGIKVSILANCMENKVNASVFSDIPEFKQFQEENGVKLKTIQPEDTPKEEKEGRELGYDPAIVFCFFAKSTHDKAPGKSVQEVIPIGKEKDFIKLKTDFPHWRQMLDDTWSSSYFLLDEHKWLSVEHYLIAKRCEQTLTTNTQMKNETKYKEIYSAFTNQKGKDNSPGNLPISDARKFVQSQSENKANLKEKEKEDAKKGEFYDIYKTLPKMTDEKLEELRIDALRAKFKEGDMRRMLTLTKPAKLIRYNRRALPTVETEIMKIRKNS